MTTAANDLEVFGVANWKGSTLEMMLRIFECSLRALMDTLFGMRYNYGLVIVSIINVVLLYR